MPSKDYRDLLAWQKALEFAEGVYEATRGFPSDERFGLTAQLRRSAVSVASNIAEGQGRFTEGDFHRFLSIAHGSLREAETQLTLAVRLRFLDDATASSLLQLAGETGRLINGLARSLKP